MTKTECVESGQHGLLIQAGVYHSHDLSYVTAYEVTRHYGGPEEGGWYYNWYTVIDTIGPTNEPTAMAEWFKNRYSDHVTGDIYSVLGGVAVSVLIEDEPAENKSTERPHYS